MTKEYIPPSGSGATNASAHIAADSAKRTHGWLDGLGQILGKAGQFPGKENVPGDIAAMRATADQNAKGMADLTAKHAAELKAVKHQATRTVTGTPLMAGIGKGKIAAVVAGVAFVGGALFLLTRKSEKEPVGRWTAQVQAERMAAHAPEPSIQQ